jgi:hypothetical protein
MDTVTGLLGAPMVPPLPDEVRAYYGNASACYAFNMKKIDWAAAQQAPDKALWSSVSQSTTKVYNRTYGGGQAPTSAGRPVLPPGNIVDDGTYFGGGGHGNGLAGPLSGGYIMDM